MLIQLQRLTILDRTIPSDVYSDVADVVKVTECTRVEFDDCSLSKEKLEYFMTRCKESKISVSQTFLLFMTYHLEIKTRIPKKLQFEMKIKFHIKRSPLDKPHFPH